MGSSADMPEAHVVHLVRYWDDGVAPVGLRTRPRRSVRANAFFGVLLGVVGVAATVAVVTLWTVTTPAWWFPLMFTVVFALMVFGLCFGYVGSLRRGRRREWAAGRWVEMLPTVRALEGTVLARDVETLEDDAVARFSLTVGIQDQDQDQDQVRVSGVWQPRSSRSGGLLQSQVPGVGAPVRVWRATDAPDAEPLVIEALDPSVIPNTAAPAPDKYVD